MADVHQLLLGMIIMILLSSVRECDSSKGNEGADGCDQYTAAVRNCIEPNRHPPNVDIPTVCRIRNETVACMAALPMCDNPPTESKNWTRFWETLNTWLVEKNVCPHRPDDTSCANFEVQAYTCLKSFAYYSGSDLDEYCGVFLDAKLCMDPLVSRCPEEGQANNEESISDFWESERSRLIEYCDSAQ